MLSGHRRIRWDDEQVDGLIKWNDEEEECNMLCVSCEVDICDNCFCFDNIWGEKWENGVDCSHK